MDILNKKGIFVIKKCSNTFFLLLIFHCALGRASLSFYLFLFYLMKTLAVIPCRLNSQRFPEKLLKPLGNRSIIQCTYENVVQMDLFDKVILACDPDIYDRIDFDCDKVCTLASHTNGTSRIGEVAKSYSADVIVNIQGDEPFIDKSHLETLMTVMSSEDTDIATLKTQITQADDLFDYNVVKVVTDTNKKALYFSRQAIPAQRDHAFKAWMDGDTSYYRHIGVYAFKHRVLLELLHLEADPLSISEKLEQLSWMYYGYCIKVGEVSQPHPGIDTESDYQAAISILGL